VKIAQVVEEAATEAAYKQQSDANAQKATFCSALVQHALINKADSKVFNNSLWAKSKG